MSDTSIVAIIIIPADTSRQKQELMSGAPMSFEGQIIDKLSGIH